jgi:pimeloyl-ACP methyl ester carboxylesterase
MATFVLVAGAWHGGWAWKRVTPLLRQAGHEAYAITLTGLGERAHLASPDLTLDTHVQDIVNVLQFEDITDAVLVGHSYAGIPVGAAAHRIPERIRHLIFLDALLPADGRSVLDTYRDNGIQEHPVRWQTQADEQGDGWLVPPPAPDSPALRVSDEADIAWMRERLTPQPLGTFTTSVRLDNPAADRLPRTYVPCLPHPPVGLIPKVTAEARDDPSWDYRELTGSHNPMISDPDTFVKLMLEIVPA